MYHQPTSPRVAAGPSIALIPDVDGHAVAPVPARIQFARQSRCFVDDLTLMPNQIQEWLDDSDGRPALSCTLHWLQTLLPGKGEEAAVRRGLANLDRRLTDPGQQLTGDDLYTLYGSLKRSVKKLCQGLEADQRPSTIAAACRELNPVFGAARGLGKVVEMAEATERAVSAVAEQSASPQRRCEAQAPRPVPKPRRSLLAGSTNPPAVPSPGGVAIAGTEKGRQAERDQQRHAQLGAAFDRLIALMPPDTNALMLKGLTAWRDSHSIPAIGFNANHVEMIGIGKEVLTLLCDTLDALDPAQLTVAARCLGDCMPNELFRSHRFAYGREVYVSSGSHVTMLVHALVDAESIPGDIQDPHRKERQRRFDGWAAAQLASSKLTKSDISGAMRGLGLACEVGERPTRTRMHPDLNIEAWRACLGLSVDPADVSPPVGADKADLAFALNRLRQRCELMGVDTAALDRFSRVWLAKQRTESPDDKVRLLQSDGAKALQRINAHLAENCDIGLKQAMLRAMVVDLEKAEDPARELCLRAAHIDA